MTAHATAFSRPIAIVTITFSNKRPSLFDGHDHYKLLDPTRLEHIYKVYTEEKADSIPPQQIDDIHSPTQPELGRIK